MISVLKINKWAGFTLAVIGFSAQAAQAPQHIDVKQYKKVEDVVVPLPNEVFGAMWWCPCRMKSSAPSTNWAR